RGLCQMTIRKQLPTILAVSFLAIGPAFGRIKPLLYREPLQGPVRTVVTENAQLANDGTEIPGTRWNHLEATYDANRRIVEEIEYGSIGKVMLRHVWACDVSGNITEILAYDRDERPSCRHILTYDAEGHVSEITCFQPRIFYTSNAVDGGGGGSGLTFSYKLECTCDSEGRITAMLIRKSSGFITYKYQQAYDERGRLIMYSRHSVDSDEDYEERYTYGEDGHVNEMLRFDGNGNLQKWHGYKYESDEHGNWVKRVEELPITRDGKVEWGPVKATYRKIQYFEK
ncbi:MAG: hypothetical protein ABIH23_25225, partial [bacterium]